MKNKLLRRLSLELCTLAAGMCIAAIIVMFMVDKEQTDLARKVIFTVSLALLEGSYIMQIAIFRSEKKNTVPTIIICIAIVILCVLLWIL